MEVSLLKKNFTLKSKDIKKTHPTKVELKLIHFLTINEIQISNIIKTIPYYFNYFQVIISHKLLTDVNNMSDLINNKVSRHLSLLSYNNEDSDNTRHLKDILLQCVTPKQVLLYSIETYASILNSLLLLNTYEITFFDMSDDNIYFTEYSKPIIKGYENSILNKHLDERYIINIIKNITDFTYKPLEIHLLFYLIINEEVSLSYALSYEICELLTQYINRPRADIINDIIKYYHTWDNYSLSVLYLHIFAIELQVFSLRETFVEDLVSSLSKNLSIDPYKRETLPEALINYNNLINKHTDWTYVNKIPIEKMILLHKLL